MKKILFSTCLIVWLFAVNSMYGQEQILWELNNLDQIGGLPVTQYGDPKLVNFGAFNAIEFDGIDDGILLNQNPVANADAFTLEVIFMPYSGGETEQRFVHVQQDDNNRMLIELRSYRSEWFLDTFIKSGSANRTLYAEDFKHPNESWHHAALVYENGRMRHYVDGELEMDSTMNYVTQTSGKTSLGMRQNFRSYFKGAIKTVRATSSVLSPDEFLQVDVVNKLEDLHNLTQKDAFRISGIQLENSTGILSLDVAKEGDVRVKLIALSGQQQLLIRDHFLGKGKQTLPLKFKSKHSGIYILQVEMGNSIQTRKVFL